MRKAYLINENEKYFLNSLHSASCHSTPLLSVVGAYNKGYTVQPSARASPKFFFRFVSKKLRISPTLSKIPLHFIFNNVRESARAKMCYNETIVRISAELLTTTHIRLILPNLLHSATGTLHIRARYTKFLILLLDRKGLGFKIIRIRRGK